MSAEPQRRVSATEYLDFERQAETRHQYYDGEFFAMSGASRRHNRINANLAAALHGRLRSSGCEEFVSDLRVHVPATGLYTYPDLVVVCGEPRFEDEHFDTLLNPILVAEVLSPSTEEFDRGKKFAHYRSITSLQAYILVAQAEVRVERFLRRSDGSWLFTEMTDLAASLDLPPVEAKVPLVDIYDRVPGLGPVER